VVRILPLLNRHGGAASYTVGQAEAALGMPFAAVLPESPRLRGCLDDGTLVGAAAPEDPWWRGIEGLALEIVDRRRQEFRGALGTTT
jgi:Flp pilus assembly CpaE family ATPase